MMEEFPPNTHKKRERPARVEKGREEDAPQAKKVEKVVSSKVVRRKKSVGSRFKEVFLGADAESVRQYIIMDVLIPAAKDMITDAVSGGVERMLFGDSHHYGRRGGRPRSRAPQVYTSYDRYSRRPGRERDRPPFPDDRRELSRRARANHQFDDIILATRAEAEEVLDRLFDLISRYETATVSDLYELLGLTAAYTDDKWGWTDIRGSDIRRVRDGYLLDLPRPEPLD